MTHSNTVRRALLALGHRAAALVAACTATIGIVGAVVLAMDGASPPRWVQPKPEIAQAVEECERQPSRATRDRCKKQLVQTAPARQSPPLLLARR